MKKIVEKVFVFFAVVMLLGSIYSKVKYGEFLLFGYKPFLILSESMEDTIMTYQIVLGKPVEACDLKVGDIAAYELYSPDTDLIKETIIHRVYAINPDGTFKFKGDNNASVDDRDVLAERIKYKIVIY